MEMQDETFLFSKPKHPHLDPVQSHYSRHPGMCREEKSSNTPKRGLGEHDSISCRSENSIPVLTENHVSVLVQYVAAFTAAGLFCFTDI